jgi:hypothetical protein
VAASDFFSIRSPFAIDPGAKEYTVAWRSTSPRFPSVGFFTTLLARTSFAACLSIHLCNLRRENLE